MNHTPIPPPHPEFRVDSPVRCHIIALTDPRARQWTSMRSRSPTIWPKMLTNISKTCGSYSKSSKKLYRRQIDKEHLALFDYVCLCMTMYDFLWMCMTVYGYGWVWMTMYGYLWLIMTMNDYIMTLDDFLQLCMTMYGYVWLYMTLYDAMSMYEYEWLCMTVYDCLWLSGLFCPKTPLVCLLLLRMICSTF